MARPTWSAAREHAQLANAAAACAGAVACAGALWKLRRLAARRAILRDAHRAGDAEEVASHEWDYIIVGGGTAGCVLANRLSAAGKRILVLEAGPADHLSLKIRVPVAVLYLFKSYLDWNFVTADKPSRGGKGLYLCRGRVLGGSSCLNVMLHTRGDQKDYDAWESDFGCTGWTGAGMLPYFRRSHDQRTAEIAAAAPKHHSQGGEMAVDHVRYQNELSARFLRACGEAGMPENPDFNDWDRPQEGFGRFQVYQRNGERSSAASAFLEPAMRTASARVPRGSGCQARDAPLLRVLCNAHACKVVFGDGLAASGVRFCDPGGTELLARLKEGGEVILAGGALHSPQLMMLSGIGPRAHLEEHGVEVLADLPGVGENLQDHPAAQISFECPDNKRGIAVTSRSCFVFGKKVPPPSAILNWLLRRRGLLTNTACDHGCFFRSSTADGSAASDSADLQLRFVPSRSVSADGMNSFAGFHTLNTRLPDGFAFQVVAARPHSRGRVRLASSDPLRRPEVEGGHLKDARDIATLKKGLKLSRQLAQQPAFSEVLGPEIFPGGWAQTDAELDKYIVNTVHTANALVGTCRMGRRSDPLAVCDSELRVFGVRGLRVCDASVMPKLPGGQAGAPVVAIADRGSDLILGRPLAV